MVVADSLAKRLGPLGRLSAGDIWRLWEDFDRNVSGRLSFAEIKMRVHEKFPFLADAGCTRAMFLAYRAAAGASEFVEAAKFPQLLENMKFVRTQ